MRDKMNYLFNDFALDDVLRRKQESIQDMVDNIQKDQFLATPYDDLVEHVVVSNSINPLEFYENQIQMSEPVECKVDVSGDQNRYIRNRSEPYLIDGVEVRVEVPFAGEPDLWKLRPRKSSSMPPVAIIERPSGETPGKIVMVFKQPHDADSQQMKHRLNENLDMIRKYLGWQKSDIERYNTSLPQFVKRAVDFRREKLKKQNGIAEILGIPLKPKEGAPSFEPITVKKKIVKQLPPPPKDGFKPEPGISGQDYENIINIIRHTGTSFEKTPKTFYVHDEEELRDIILSHLNTYYEGKAKGETFNKSGKTDILISKNDRSAFIGECKIWRGQKTFTETIDQLLGYLTWRDCKTALIIFNRHNKDFSRILESVAPTVEAHPHFIHHDKQIDENEWHFTMRSKDDESRQIRMRVMVFNLYLPS